MNQPTRRHRSAGRIIGRGLVIGIYSVLLVVAADISAVDDSTLTAGPVGGAAPAADAATERDPLNAAAMPAGEGTESPLATLAIIAVAGGLLTARAVRLARRPRPAAVRPIARRVGTLT